MIKKIVSLPFRALKRILKGASQPDPTPPSRPQPKPQKDPPQWMMQDNEQDHGHSHEHNNDDQNDKGDITKNIDVILEETPNPNAQKFVLHGATIPNSFSANGPSDDNHPLAESLLKIEGVASIFGINDFVTVTKSEDINWEKINPVIITTIKDHF